MTDRQTQDWITNVKKQFGKKYNLLSAGAPAALLFFLSIPVPCSAQAAPAKTLTDAELLHTFKTITQNTQSKKTLPLALTQVNELLKIVPQNPGANLLKATILCHMDEYEEALPVIEKANQLNLGSAPIWNRKADILFHLKKYNQALEALTHAEKESGKRSRSLVKANCLIGTNRLAEAEKEFEWLVSQSAEDVTILGRRVDLYIRMEKWQKAVDDLTVLLSSTKKGKNSYSVLLSKRGECYTHLKEYARAIADYKETLNTAPDDRRAHSALMNLYTLTKDSKDAAAEKKFLESLDVDLRLYK